ncbi:MAG: alpha-glucuronidase [Chitinophagaceae bacterium]|nr:alpha-glucuronidase [Chitinophagaceae bacterium]
MKKPLILLLTFLIAGTLLAEDGYRLWLRYDLLSDKTVLNKYRTGITAIVTSGNSATAAIAKEELQNGLQGLLGKKILPANKITDGTIVAGTPTLKVISSLSLGNHLAKAGKEGFIIISTVFNGKKIIAIAANTDIGVLYGTFYFLRLLQTQQAIDKINILSVPKIQNRILNHWDNLNRTVERGYAGFSIWDWHKLPDYIDQRYIDYARANASIGINGTVLTNVNANALVLTKTYLEKVAALANTFRPYGIKVYLTARFSAPIEIGGLKTADPLNTEVQQWWKNKTNEIYQYIPDFGGFLVKANSEGQPGPQNYGRSHADGANMLADAVASHGGIVMWRAFVYSNETPDDRFKQAYNEFKPLDGQFRKNVLVQVKNGPIDFQPREPFHPLFGAMPNTPLMMEFQVTQEYLGQGTNLVYLSTMFKEVLDADTYSKGKGSTVAQIVDGSLDGHTISAMAGVANIGNDRNWTGHPFAQANWYAYGRLAWDHDLASSQIADEWIRQTFTNEKIFVDITKRFMLASHQILVNYMTPLGLNHIMGNGHHYGPSPWSANLPRADWNPVYYHRADSAGIGFDRTTTGSNALAQYANEVADRWKNVNTCPDEYLLWFHHVGWNHKMRSGRTLWEELCYKYYEGVDSIKAVQGQWDKLEKFIDKERFSQVKMLLAIQVNEAIWWRNACLLYFQTFAKMPVPGKHEQPDKTLEYYKSLRFPFAPGN